MSRTRVPTTKRETAPSAPPSITKIYLLIHFGLENPTRAPICMHETQHIPGSSQLGGDLPHSRSSLSRSYWPRTALSELHRCNKHSAPRAHTDAQENECPSRKHSMSDLRHR